MEKLTYSVKEFCALHGISRSTFYELLRGGQGPAMMLLGRRRLVSVEAAKNWRLEMAKGIQSEGHIQ